MANSRATWFSYFYSRICFLLITFSPHRKPVSLCCTSITSPNWPFPIFLPIAKSLFLNYRGAYSIFYRICWLYAAVESIRLMPFLGLGISTTSAVLYYVVGAMFISVCLAAFLGDSNSVLAAVSVGFNPSSSTYGFFFLNIPPGSSRFPNDVAPSSFADSEFCND